MSSSVNKRELVLALLEQRSIEGYCPAAFFTHFPPEFHFGRAAIDKHEEFFRCTGMDFVKVQFELQAPRFEIKSPLDWQRFPTLPLSFFRPQIEVVRGLVERLRSEAVVVLTLYSPYMMAGQIGGHALLDQHLKEAPEATAKGIGIIAESIVPFVNACAETGLDGFYHSTQGGESGRFSDPAIFRDYVKPFDLRVMKACEELGRSNILHICDYSRAEVGSYENLEPFIDYPGHIINTWHGHQTPKEIARMFGRPYMGGMDRLGDLAKGTPEQAAEAARKALAKGPSILAADCTVPGEAPWENLKAAVEVAHGA